MLKEGNSNNTAIEIKFYIAENFTEVDGSLDETIMLLKMMLVPVLNIFTFLKEGFLLNLLLLPLYYYCKNFSFL